MTDSQESFFMKIHEYQGKEILRSFGVPVPRGIPAFTVQEAVEAAVQEKLKGGDPQKKAPEGNKELETQIETLMRGY